MKPTRSEHSWEAFLRFYNEQYKGRKTRLGVFERHGDVTNDYWLESGLPFVGIDLDPTADRPSIEVLLDGYSHTISNVAGLDAHFSHEGDEDGLDIRHEDDTSTILRFESR